MPEPGILCGTIPAWVQAPVRREQVCAPTSGWSDGLAAELGQRNGGQGMNEAEALPSSWEKVICPALPRARTGPLHWTAWQVTVPGPCCVAKARAPDLMMIRVEP